MTGLDVTGKVLNLVQLQAELASAGVSVSGLGTAGDSPQPTMLFTYDAQNQPADFPVGQQATVQSTVNAHVAMRCKTTEELATEFQNPATTPERKQTIRDIQAGLLPCEQVPM
jgi:hypothetical protein